VIGVLVVDDHPAVRAGLAGLLQSEPGFSCIAAVGSAEAGIEAARRTEPTVVLADYELPDHDGLTLCSELKALANAPRVIVYSAFARPRLLPAAAVAGADAMVDKGAPAEELFEAIRIVATGRSRLPAPPPEVMERSYALLDTDEIVLFGMAVNGAPPSEIAAVSGDHPDEIRRQLRGLLERLQTRPTEPEPPPTDGLVGPGPPAPNRLSAR
jgi:two-component system, NarL family, response regulator DevR